MVKILKNLPRTFVLIFPLFFTIFIREAVSQNRFSFRNFNIAMGFNRTSYDIQFPEIVSFSDESTKESLLIDLRGQLYLSKGFVFIPNFEVWSWGVFPSSKESIVKRSMDEFTVNLDFARFFKASEKFLPYWGAGIGIHILVIDVEFPNKNYIGSGARPIRSIYEKRYRSGTNVFGGFEFKIIPSLTFFIEGRWEKTNLVEQWKYLLGVSMF